MAESAPGVARSADPVAAAAERLVEAVGAALASRGCARVAISGGSALAAVGPARAVLGRRGLWQRVALTWADERCVPFADLDSNRGQAYRSGALSASDSPGAELALFLDGETPEQAVARTRARLAAGFGDRIDVCLLGLGEDGHSASLFGAAGCALGGAEPVAAVTDSPKPPPKRITLTLALLKTAMTTIVVAAGEGKRAALERLMAGDDAVPAAHLPGVIAITDLDLRRPSP